MQSQALRDDVGHHDSRYAVFPPPFALDDFTFSMIWHERTEADPAHAWLRERVLAAAASQESEEPISLRG